MFQFFRDFIVVIVLMSVVFGCGKAPSGKEEAAAKTLTFWHIMNYSGPKEVLEGAVKRFEAAHPGVKVIVQTFENDAYSFKHSTFPWRMYSDVCPPAPHVKKTSGELPLAISFASLTLYASFSS